MTQVALTIAGSDPSGGAGLQADLKTFQDFGVYGEAVVTLITVQNTRRLTRVEHLAADLVIEQITAVMEDIPPHAAKIGALGSRAVVEAVAEAARGFGFPLVVDPILSGTLGGLLEEGAFEALVRRLLPLAFLLTPNLGEAAAIAEFPVEDRASMLAAAKAMQKRGARNVLVKGGHLIHHEPGEALDVLVTEDGAVHEFVAPRIVTPHTHGSGCRYAAAITAELAKGTELVEAVSRAKRYVTETLFLSLGRGPLP
jgi:hydroxymethylpyrimidine/phosphomethylpyrimidine kinase